MASEITMPQLGLTMTEGTVSQWLRKEGDTLTKGDEIVEIETDKINNIVEAHEDGVLLKIVAQEGDSLPVKGVLGYIGQAGESIGGPRPAAPAVAVPAASIPADGKTRIVVIGAGPGGYVTAIRAAQLGAAVSIVECGAIGGTCLNVGCIPTKALIHASSLYESVLRQTAAVGISVTGAAMDWAQAQQYKNSIVKRLVGGVEGLLKANGVKKYSGKGIITDAHTVQVGSEKITADAIILAVGSEPVQLRFPGADLPGVIDSTGALALRQIPKSLVIIGGGVIGIEFASMFAAVGTQCTIVEALPHILPPIDTEIVALIQADLERRGIRILTDAKVTMIDQDGTDLQVHMDYQGRQDMVRGETVIMAVGRRAMTAGMGLEELGIAMDRGKIVTADHFQTNIPSIFAIGDCNGRLMLAHAASAQGIAAAEYILTGKSAYHAETVPSCIYLEPEAASVGLKEEELQAKGTAYVCGRFPLSGNGKALIENGGVGMIKILADATYGQILGVHMYGPRVTDLIAACALAIRLEATAEELTTTIWAHPTVGEAIGEAALDLFGHAIHWPPKKK